MDNSWKMGVVFGLAAGLVSGIVAYICHLILPSFGLLYPYYYEYFPGAPINNMALFYILLSLIWGPIYGVIFSKAYAAIPGKNMLKGVCYGLVIFLFWGVRDATFWVPYGAGQFVISMLFVTFFASVAYGIMIGILYRRDVELVGRFDFGKGFYVSTLAGLIGGAVGFLVAVPVNFWLSGLVPDAEAIMIQAVNHITINAFWGVVFGLVFTKVYDLVPGKGALKGLVFSLIIFLMESGHTSLYYYGEGNFGSVITNISIGGLRAVAFGLALGYLYRKPSE
jgi:hypothetical protein